MSVKVHCPQSTMLSVIHAVYRYVKETLYLSLCVSVGTSILAACVTISVLDRTIFLVLNLNAAVLVQMPCPSHHCGARMAFTLQLYCCQVSICSAAKANIQELYAYCLSGASLCWSIADHTNRSCQLQHLAIKHPLVT